MTPAERYDRAIWFAVVLAVVVVLFLNHGCAIWNRQDAKTVVDVAKAWVEEICSPDDPTLDACIDKLLSARRKAQAQAGDAGGDR